MTLYILLTRLAAGLVLLGSSVGVVTQFERGVVLRFGRLSGAVGGPGLTLITSSLIGCRGRRLCSYDG
jgi:regulator of protease activity HflC (stomatin/prohibitin superfamily)